VVPVNTVAITAVLRVDGQHDAHQVGQRVGEPRVGQLVPGPSTFGDGDDQAATPQAGQVVGQALPAHLQQVRQIRGIGRAFPQGQQDPGPGRVGQGVPEPGQHPTKRQSFHNHKPYSTACIHDKVN
jgi:hypothetical protein